MWAGGGVPIPIFRLNLPLSYFEINMSFKNQKLNVVDFKNTAKFQRDSHPNGFVLLKVISSGKLKTNNCLLSWLF